MSSVHVVGGGPVDDYRTTFGIVEVPSAEDAPTDAAFSAFEVKLPAPEHPAPWRYDELGPNGAGRVVDANGEVVIESSDEFESVEFADGALALVLAAPEMEALLRELQLVTNEHRFRECPICLGDAYPSCEIDKVKHEPGCRFGDLLARIDAAKVG